MKSCLFPIIEHATPARKWANAPAPTHLRQFRCKQHRPLKTMVVNTIQQQALLLADQTHNLENE